MPVVFSAISSPMIDAAHNCDECCLCGANSALAAYAVVASADVAVDQPRTEASFV